MDDFVRGLDQPGNADCAARLSTELGSLTSAITIQPGVLLRIRGGAELAGGVNRNWNAGDSRRGGVGGVARVVEVGGLGGLGRLGSRCPCPRICRCVTSL